MIKNNNKIKNKQASLRSNFSLVLVICIAFFMALFSTATETINTTNESDIEYKEFYG